jgi:hypothetical protein
MSAIFKARKIPKHLIIQEDTSHIRKPRVTLFKLVLWSVVILVLTWSLLQGQQILTEFQ